MRVSKNWLNDFVDVSGLSAEELEDFVTTKVAEVDGVHILGAALAQAVCVEVLEVKSHPERDKLTICKVSDSNKEYTVVCGARNVRAGLKTAYLPVGSKIILSGEEVEITSRDFAGVKSSGMLVSESELDAGPESEGILEIGDSLKLGQSLTRLYGEPDVVLEIDNKSLTNRPDLWSHFGFAREISAILGNKLKLDHDKFSDASDEGKKALTSLGENSKKWKVEISKDTEARRFSAIHIENVEAIPSPIWMRRRLYNVGAGVRNQLVDLSNYVMLDSGQPNHAYDADKLSGSTIYVKLAKESEEFLALDGETYKLSSDDVVIADESGSVALGGVIGGNESAVSDSTTSLLLESANFDPVRTRLTTKKHSLRTDASNRFEKDRTPYSVPLGTRRYLQLLTELQPEAKIVSKFADCYPEKPKPTKISLTKGYIQERLGADIKEKKVLDILESLSFEIKENKSGYSITTPYFRVARDVTIAEDLVEEVGRIYGYENIPEVAPLIASEAVYKPGIKELEYMLADSLRGAGFSQYESYSFLGGEANKNLVSLKNPVDVDLAHMRSSLVPSMIEALKDNLASESEIRLFELGRVFEKPNSKSDTPAIETRKICLGFHLEKLSGKSEADSNFFSLFSVVKRVVSLADLGGLNLKPCTKVQAWMHSFRAAQIHVGGKQIGVISEVDPALSGKKQLAICEIDLGLLNSLSEEGSKQISAISKYPVSYFEMSVVMPKTTYFSELAEIIGSSIESQLLKNLEILSVYSGKPLAADQKSVSVKLSLGSDDRTLSGEELEEIQNNLMAAVDKSEFELRS